MAPSGAPIIGGTTRMLVKYLQQITEGKPVNYQKLLALLPPAFYQQRKELFRVRASGAGKWQVQIADASLFAALVQSAAQPKDRITASQQGDSHRATTSASYLLMYHQLSALPRPDIVLAQGQSDGAVALSYGFTPKKILLLIENEENFFRYPQVLALGELMQATEFSLANVDVALAAGSRVGSALLQPFFSQYQQIWCAFDYDAAALELFDHLAKRYGSRLRFLTAPDLTPWHAKFQALPKNPSQLNKAVELARLHRLDGLADAFLATKHFMEQEVLLG
jgi:hypothetical protein